MADLRSLLVQAVPPLWCYPFFSLWIVYHPLHWHPCKSAVLGHYCEWLGACFLASHIDHDVVMEVSYLVEVVWNEHKNHGRRCFHRHRRRPLQHVVEAAWRFTAVPRCTPHLRNYGLSYGWAGYMAWRSEQGRAPMLAIGLRGGGASLYTFCGDLPRTCWGRPMRICVFWSCMATLSSIDLVLTFRIKYSLHPTVRVLFALWNVCMPSSFLQDALYSIFIPSDVNVDSAHIHRWLSASAHVRQTGSGTKTALSQILHVHVINHPENNSHHSEWSNWAYDVRCRTTEWVNNSILLLTFSHPRI